MIICLILIFIISFVCARISIDFDESKANTIFFAIIGFISIIAIIIYVNTPKPIDVYKNKTTLEITYKNGIPIDSVVVFKDKEK